MRCEKRLRGSTLAWYFMSAPVNGRGFLNCRRALSTLFERTELPLISISRHFIAFLRTPDLLFFNIAPFCAADHAFSESVVR